MQTDNLINPEWFTVNAPEWQLIRRESYTDTFYFLCKVEDHSSGIIWFDEDYSKVLVKIKLKDIPINVIDYLKTIGLQ